MGLAYLVLLVCSLVEVNSQTFPYVSFMIQTPLANHSYVDLSLVGDDSSNSVQCHTDLSTCCSGGQGIHRGDWYFPNGDRLQFSGDIFEERGAERVDIRRNSATSPVGIYRCDIPTNAVHDDNDDSVRATVYVGLYTASGGKLEAAEIALWFVVYLLLLLWKTIEHYQVEVSILGNISRFFVVAICVT